MNHGEHSNRPSATKRGPGRYHSNGHSKATPIPPRGAVGMVLHKASSARKQRRDLVQAHGRRQALKMLKFWRAEHKAANDERSDARSSRHYEQPELA